MCPAGVNFPGEGLPRDHSSLGCCPAVPVCPQTLVPTAVPEADQGPKAGVTLGPAAVLGVTPGLGLMAVGGT